MTEKRERTYKVHLYRDADCARGWLAYLDRYQYRTGDGDEILLVKAINGTQAKSRAITRIRAIEAARESKV